MRNKITRKTLSYVLSISFIFAFIVFCKPQNVYASYSRYVTASSLTVRKKASSKGKVKGYYKKGAKVTCYKKKGSWTRLNTEAINTTQRPDIYPQRNQQLQQAVLLQTMEVPVLQHLQKANRQLITHSSFREDLTNGVVKTC